MIDRLFNWLIPTILGLLALVTIGIMVGLGVVAYHDYQHRRDPIVSGWVITKQYLPARWVSHGKTSTWEPQEWDVAVAGHTARGITRMAWYSIDAYQWDGLKEGDRFAP